MIKADIIYEVKQKTGLEKVVVQAIVESLMTTMKDSMCNGENLYLRGFGSFILKKRAEKVGRNISRNTPISFQAHYIPIFKPSKEFSSLAVNLIASGK
jgi:DNA-binding protein HU-beta